MGGSYLRHVRLDVQQPTKSSSSTNQAAAATSSTSSSSSSSSSTVDVIRGSEVHDGYFRSYSHFPEASAYCTICFEHFQNERDTVQEFEF